MPCLTSETQNATLDVVGHGSCYVDPASNWLLLQLLLGSPLCASPSPETLPSICSTERILTQQSSMESGLPREGEGSSS